MKMKKRERKAERMEPGQDRRVLTISIAAAFIASIAVFGVLLKIEKDTLTKYEKGTIYTAAVPIPRGELITEENCETYFEKKELDKSCIPETAISSPSQVNRLIAGSDIEAGVLLTTGMFEELEEIMEELAHPVIAGFKAEDIHQVAGGVLRAGDRIHIYSIKEEGEAASVWKNVFVQQVFDGAGNVIANENTAQPAQRINIYLEEAEAEGFYQELEKGALRVVKVCD